MTLPKKASRDIEVNGRRYRWMVRKVGAGPSVRLTVEDPGTGEVRQKDFHERWEITPAVRPGKVRDFILNAFRAPDEALTEKKS